MDISARGVAHTYKALVLSEKIRERLNEEEDQHRRMVQKPAGRLLRSSTVLNSAVQAKFFNARAEL